MVTQSQAPAILLTRPLAQSDRFAAQLQAKLGPLSIVCAPLLAPTYLQVTLPSRPYCAVVLTSETAVEAARRISATGQVMPDLAFCVGDQTAEKASAAGFRAVSAKGDARALVALVLASGVGGPILYLRAEEAREDLAALVSSGGIETDSLVAYTQGAQGLSPDGRQMLRGESPVILPLFSPRSAQILVSVMPSGPIAPLWVAAMSEAVALAATPLRAEKIFTAPHPDADSMIATVARLLAAAAGA